MKHPDIDPIALTIFDRLILLVCADVSAAFFLCWRTAKATRGTGDRGSDQQISTCYLLAWWALGVGASVMSCFTDLMLYQ